MSAGAPRTKDEWLREVCRLAGIAVLETPREGNRTGQVRRSILNQLEDALTAAGYDMPKARTAHDARVRLENKQARAKRDAAVVAKFALGSRVQRALYDTNTKDCPSVERLEEGVVLARSKKPGRVVVKWDMGLEAEISAYSLDDAPLRRVPA
jgi:hypothetical protein